MLFVKGDKIVHPAYGAGTVESIEEKIVDGEKKPYYILEIAINNLQVSISASKASELHVRRVLSENELRDKISSAKIGNPLQGDNWTVSYKKNLEKVKSGDASEVASVIKYLINKEKKRSLSATEKKTLHSASQIILSEIILSCGVQRLEAENILKKLID
jgi:CarD family transcriptional regulator